MRTIFQVSLMVIWLFAYSNERSIALDQKIDLFTVAKKLISNQAKTTSSELDSNEWRPVKMGHFKTKSEQ